MSTTSESVYSEQKANTRDTVSEEVSGRPISFDVFIYFARSL